MAYSAANYLDWLVHQILTCGLIHLQTLSRLLITLVILMMPRICLEFEMLFLVHDTNTPTTHFVTVLSNTGTVVDVSDGTAIAETDGD